jgi:hypothetical protein
MIPHLSGQAEEREAARGIAARWSEDDARYCFSMGLDPLCQWVESGEAQVDFASLSYDGQGTPPVSKAHLCHVGVEPFFGGIPVTIDDRAADMRDILRVYGVSQSGNKGQLALKLATLAAEVYQAREGELNRYFTGQQFIRTSGLTKRVPSRFPVLRGCELRDTVLSMYLLRHLRGDAILDAEYVDDSYDLEDLARAVVEGRVRMSGAFLKAA